MKEIMKARKKEAPVKPPAELEPRPGDFDLPTVFYLVCKVFALLKQKPGLDKYPGSLRLRRYDANEVICWQGEPGWSAFSLLSGDDVPAMQRLQAAVAANAPAASFEDKRFREVLESVAKDQKRADAVRAARLPPPLAGGGPAVTVFVDPSRAAVARPRGWLSRLFRPAAKDRRRAFIPVDAPTTVDYGTRKATMPDGSLFGQWGCVYGTPRSATVVTNRPVYVLEMLRNVLDYVLDDKQFQEDNDRDYVENVLRNHLTGLPIFRELTAEQFAELRADVRLRRFRDGEVIFSMGDDADSFYVVRRGVVKVLLDHGRAAGSENVLTYLSQGDFFGEIGVMAREEEEKKRTATCVAYVHPRPEGDEADPEADRWRRNERVELVEIPGSSLHQLCAKHKSIKDKVEREIASRKRRSDERRTAEAAPARQSDRFQQLGLIQGQKLMLIDLDRCTRCDECVEACVAQHDDGRARLFLDGPRFGKYLVPTTCRACRDPVCLIGCPVGSIRRGDNLQIVIEDWCIGCTLCAKNCPYGSILMHDVGLLAEEAHGWRWRRRDRVNGDAWSRPGFLDLGWDDARAPVWWDCDRDDFDSPAALCFRLDFALRGAADPEGGYKLVIDTASAEIKVEGAGRSARVAAFPPVWLNGVAVPAEKWKPDRGQFVFELLGDDRKLLRPGRNVIAAQLTPPAGRRAVLLQAALDEIRPSGAVIPLKAVVCDQCSELPGREPACVHACPHDAAMRVDAWTRFPG